MNSGPSPIIDVAKVEHEQRRSTTELIEAGESKTVEYKQTARYNPHTGKVDKRLEHSVLKSVAGFMNASGGVLLIGVHDRQDPSGMADDYSTTGNNGRDGFENWLITRLDRADWQVADRHPCRRDVRRVPGGRRVSGSMSGRARSRSTSAATQSSMCGWGTRPGLYNTKDAMEYIRSRW